MAKVLKSSLRAGESVTMRAERLLQLDQPQVHIPRYVDEMRDAAKFVRGPGDPNLLEQAVKRWEKQVARLGQGAATAPGEFTVRSATQQLIVDLRRAKPEQVDRIIDRWILERARYQARVVARHESVEAMRDQQLKGFADTPWVKGVRWMLSPAHPRPDICDVLAGQDLYGFGPGGYPLDRVPARHTSCLCYLVAIIDPHHMKRELAQLRGTEEPPKPWLSERTESAEEWLLRQDAKLRLQIIGPTREAFLQQGKRITTRDHSRLRKVHNLQGKRRPVRNMGPKVDATKLIAADRAKMRQQFPAL